MPKSPGIYFFRDNAGKIIYIGKAKSLRDRVASYFTTPKSQLLPKTASLVAEIEDIDHIVTQSEIDAFILEANMIRKFAPKYNINWKDGKSYPLIEITVKDKIPMVKSVHQETNPKARYFGPYTTGTDLFSLLRFLRRVFPFVSQNHPSGRPCLRSHLGLCPCPGVYQDEKKRLEYRQNIKKLISFLEGKRLSVQKQLLSEMNSAAKNQNFEQAADLKSKLAKIELLTAPRTPAWEYEVNPNFTSDRLQNSLTELQMLLKIPTLHKIECYDISNISGKSATGAQVTFIEGLPDKSLYRRYRIKLKTTPDDFSMLKEVLSRRMKSNIPLPELMVIDGGKGQIKAASSTFTRPGLVKVIGLAKKIETIYTDDGKTISLPLSSSALQLLQNLRDEAHRFSRKYHFFLRSQKMLS